MNCHIFRNCIENTVLPFLDRLSCLIMDNAFYHNKVPQEDKVATSSSTKDEIKIWLTKKQIPFNDMYLKPELFSLVNQTQRGKNISY
jgi:hypothetical protein